MHAPRISMIAALGENRELGKHNELIWRIPSDLKRVRDLTMGHPLIMGRKTHESIGRPLPGRTNIVISTGVREIPGCTVVSSLEEALDHARTIDSEEIFIFGGARVYTDALPHTDRLYLTLIHAGDSEADAFFPDYNAFTHVVGREDHLDHTPPFSYLTLERSAS